MVAVRRRRVAADPGTCEENKHNTRHTKKNNATSTKMERFCVSLKAIEGALGAAVLGRCSGVRVINTENHMRVLSCTLDGTLQVW